MSKPELVAKDRLITQIRSGIFDATFAHNTTMAARNTQAQRRREAIKEERTRKLEAIRRSENHVAQMNTCLMAAASGMGLVQIEPPIEHPKTLLESGFEIWEYDQGHQQAGVRPYVYTLRDGLGFELYPFHTNGSLFIVWINSAGQGKDPEELLWLCGREGQAFVRNVFDLINNEASTGKASCKFRLKKQAGIHQLTGDNHIAYLPMAEHEVPISLTRLDAILINQGFKIERHQTRLGFSINVLW